MDHTHVSLSYVEFALGFGMDYKPVSLNPSSTFVARVVFADSENGGEYTNLPDIAR